MPSRYRGRFAPSPTGPLHFGSLVAAVASFCEARVHGGEWLVRIEDLDLPRSVPGASERILRSLDACGFTWDGEVIVQSSRTEHYAAALRRLQEAGRVFACGCTRREIADSAISAAGEQVYPGTCRNGLPRGREARSFRLRVDEVPVEFEDAVQGTVHQSLARDVGDFVLKRADGWFAYQLAVVVDDDAQGITDVVRGADLLGSTARQICLQRLLGYATPRYAHVPVATNAAGEKLSKQTLAPAIEAADAVRQLVDALRFLGQAPPANLTRATTREVWAWAREHWSIEKVPRMRQSAAQFS
jgi:glutamyl-Q tRNA(Asp) synthetase